MIGIFGIMITIIMKRESKIVKVVEKIEVTN